ncbi:GNAT family N-acetyltransferase [Haloferax namakaokahaiae]|uniref:GNAT family N-acetyltransferase n=1 Tax=Haloferax namakaokahaiae TaxID=1748331 RepID=A0ABD5ZD91_9EURY
MGIRTRHAVEADGSEILDLWHGFTSHLSSFDDRYGHSDQADERWLRYFENQLIDSKYGTVILAEADDEDTPIGVLEARVMGDHPIFRLANHGYVNGLYVREEYRGEGVAGELLDAAAEWFTEGPRAVNYYRIDVLAGDEAASKMLESHGLEPVELVYEERL